MLIRSFGDDNNRTTVAISGNGATITQWQVGERHVFYPKQFTNNRTGALKERGGCFIGAPVFGHPEKAMAIDLPQHGTVRQSAPFISDKLAENAACFRFLTPGLLTELEGYPFKWSLEVTDTVYANGFHREMEVVRLPTNGILFGLERMPFNIGLHPYFSAPGKVEIGNRMIQFQDTPKTMKIEVPEDGKVMVHLDFGVVTMEMTGYKWLNLWSDHSDKYFCVEPLWDHPQKWGTKEGKYLEGGKDKSLVLTCAFTFSE